MRGKLKFSYPHPRKAACLRKIKVSSSNQFLKVKQETRTELLSRTQDRQYMKCLLAFIPHGLANIQGSRDEFQSLRLTAAELGSSSTKWT
jgi:hypothetical protein